MGCAASSASASAPASALALVDFNARFADEYVVREKIGVGQQGTVYLCEDAETGTTRAMKETHIGVFGANAKRREAYCEIELLSQMRHPNVVRMVKAYQTSAEVQVVMEHAGRDTLLTYLVALDDAEGMTEEEKMNIKYELIRQLVDAVAHVHSRDVVFRDLKHENVMVTSDDDLRNAQIKLVDFGRAASLRREDRLNNQPPLGTSLFQAPEVEERREYGQAADMWAVGVFVYFLVTGQMPFEHTVAGLYKVLRGEYEPMEESINKHARDLVAKLLVLDPAKRINAAQASTHRFLRQRNAAHVHVGEGDALRVPKHMEKAAKRQLRALVMQDSLELHTVGLLAEKLTPEDLKTLRRWLRMKAEMSVRGGVANAREKNASHSISQRQSPDASIRAGHTYTDELQAHVALNALYNEMTKDQGSESNSREVSFHGGALTKTQSYLKLTEALENLEEMSSGDEADVHRPSPPKKISKSSLSDAARQESAQKTTGTSDIATSRSFVGYAHQSGMCTVDELITACISAGLQSVADELQTVRDDLKKERLAKLAATGADTQTQNESVLLDIMLFRYEDLLAKVENAHLDQVKDWSVRAGVMENGL
jgi:serine/threonine protein kinase